MTDQDRKKIEAEIKVFLDILFIREEIPPLTPKRVVALEKRKGIKMKRLFSQDKPGMKH
ncbi:MAG TPA: hypothetical protein VN437_08990 [Rectinemataceae bacterium]|nr:hypothetical protein [Rectinemataceae bacterium]